MAGCPGSAGPGTMGGLPQPWSCLGSSSLFDLERVITLKQLSTGPWVWRQVCPLQGPLGIY